jgi:hypothetical protein
MDILSIINKYNIKNALEIGGLHGILAQKYFNLKGKAKWTIIEPNPIVPESTCPGPQISLTSQSSGAASFSWNAVSGATEYVVFYIRHGDNYTSPLNYIQSTSFVYSDLPSGKYNFCFATVCGNGLSQIIIIEDLVI